jgi:hypothetical protein
MAMDARDGIGAAAMTIELGSLVMGALGGIGSWFLT